MESVEGTLVYIKTKIKSIREEVEKQYVSGIGKEAIFKDKPIGYFIGFEGSYEAIHFGTTVPKDWKVGDEIKISFEKIIK